MEKSEKINRLHRRGTSCNARPYNSAPVPSPITSGGIEHSPVTPVGLGAHRSEQIDAVIQQLTNDAHEIPTPFTERDLYRTAASAGIAVWNPAVKERFTDRILDRLNYEWDPASQTFAPVVTRELIEGIRKAAGTITPVFDTELSESHLAACPYLPLMGSYVRIPSWEEEPGGESGESETQLGDLLSGRLADLAIDSVKAVRDERGRE
ncbi:hypothetical protein ACNS7O_05450 [Haloferacaceae archaeon DSL9]